MRLRITVNTEEAMEELWSEINQDMNRMTADLHATLLEETPIDTGRAKKSWVPTIGHPEAVEVPEAGEYPPPEWLHRYNATKLLLDAQSKGLRNLNRAVSSSLFYMHGLAYEGRSQQAKPGWVETTAALVEARFDADQKGIIG